MAKIRLPISTFEFPLAEFRRGYRSAIYFNRTKHILENYEDVNQQGTMQVFQKNKGILCGIDEVVALLRQCVGWWEDERKAHTVFDWYMQAKLEARKKPLDLDAAKLVIDCEQALDALWVDASEDLEIHAMYDGYWISPWETVLTIKGDYSTFAHLESIYLGILARGTKVATNVHNVVQAANGKQVLFFADRFDRWSNQGADGYAAHIGGAQGVASEAMGAWWGERAMGTMPHALIAMFEGDTAEAAAVFNKMYPDTHTVALVDFNNDCITDALCCAEELGDDLWGVRLDTSENMVDPAVHLSPLYGQYKPTGVNPMLVERLRETLDDQGFGHVKIIVSGGFNPEKIKMFEEMSVPVDAYAVGSSLLAGTCDFTADIVEPVAKQGRKLRPNDRLELVTFTDKK
jgi:nicotinate phosphoribosyltransferase